MISVRDQIGIKRGLWGFIPFRFCGIADDKRFSKEEYSDIQKEEKNVIFNLWCDGVGNILGILKDVFCNVIDYK
jgi:hypothetical protein